ncbi:MAG: YitT family protein [Ruminococcaceae bacterium]|nr:YitT family protein [Oscillospiraceae bacterium]
MKKLKKINAYLFIIAAAVLLAFTYQLFIVKNNFAPAGINGIATMIQYKTGFSIGYMSLIINVPLCLLAYFFVNRDFAKKSLLFCIVYSFVYLGLQKIDFTSFQYDAGGHDTIYPVIISGTLGGLVYGICARHNASTGGTDIVSKYISIKKPYLNFFWITLILNAIVAIISFFVYAKPDTTGAVSYDYKPVCLCIIYCFISTFLGNVIIQGSKQAYKFTVITTHADEISDEILHTLHHGATKLSAVGAYKNQEKDVLICVVNKHQIVDFQNILEEYDNTFSFVENVGNTFGNFAKVK